MEDIDKHIATGHKPTTACSSLINVGQCNRSADTAKSISKNHKIRTVTANTYSVYNINYNIEHGNTHRFVTPNGVHPSRNSVFNNISNI